MINLFKGWLKIYLFYGAIFFLLGFFGLLASDQIKLSNWSARQIQKISRMWEGLITFQEDNNKTITAFTNQSGKIVLQVYQTEEIDRKYSEMLLKLQRELHKRFKQVIFIPVSDFNTKYLKVANSNTPLIVIGYRQSPNQQRGNLTAQSSLYFGMPEPAINLFAGKLIQNLALKIPSFCFTKQEYGYSTIYELNWNTNGETSNSDNEVFSEFMKIMDQGIIQTLNKQTSLPGVW